MRSEHNVLLSNMAPCLAHTYLGLSHKSLKISRPPAGVPDL